LNKIEATLMLTVHAADTAIQQLKEFNLLAYTLYMIHCDLSMTVHRCVNIRKL